MFELFLKAMPVAFGWGILSILINPCHLAAIPLVIGLIDRKQDCCSVRRSGLLAFMFALGMATIVMISGTILQFFSEQVVHFKAADVLFAVIMILTGLNIAGIIRFFDWHAHIENKMPRLAQGESLQLYLFGLLWGLALGTCNITHIMPVLLAPLQADSRLTRLLLIGAYALGQVAVLTAAGCFTQKVHKVLDWHKRTRWGGALRIVCGLAVIALGVWVLFHGHPHDHNHPEGEHTQDCPYHSQH